MRMNTGEGGEADGRAGERLRKGENMAKVETRQKPETWQGLGKDCGWVFDMPLHNCDSP